MQEQIDKHGNKVTGFTKDLATMPKEDGQAMLNDFINSQAKNK